MNSHLLFIVWAALLLGAAALFPADSRAASCCGGGSAASLSVPKYAVAVADLSFDTELYDGFWDQGGKHRPDPPASDLKQLRLNMGFGYRFARDWQTSISLPYIWNDNKYSGVSSTSNGLGDTTISVMYELLDDNSTWKVSEAKDLIPAVTIGMSLLLPTGISPYDREKSSFDITGRGFYRLDGTLLIEKTVRPWNVSLALAYGTYFDRSVNREYGKYVEPYTKGLGDRFSASIAAGYSFILGTGGDSITTTASYAYLNEGDASYNGISDSGSGFDKQSVGAVAAYSSNDHNWGLRLGWTHAIQQNGWGMIFLRPMPFQWGYAMSFYKTLCTILIAAGLLASAGCGDNLFPSGADRRPNVQSGSSGDSVNQNALDFAVSDTNGATVTLASSLAGRKGAVFYFTMWCPSCDSQMSNLRSSVVPLFPDVNFFIVDYVSGSVAGVASAASANGFAGGVFTTLADVNNMLENNFQGTMGTTVVVDNTGKIRMNEDYRDGTRLQATLSGLP